MKKTVRQKKTPDFLQAAFEKIGKCVYIYRKCVKQIEKSRSFKWDSSTIRFRSALVANATTKDSKQEPKPR